MRLAFASMLTILAAFSTACGPGDSGGSTSSGGAAGSNSTGGSAGTGNTAGTNSTGGAAGTNSTGGAGGTNSTGGSAGAGGCREQQDCMSGEFCAVYTLPPLCGGMEDTT